MINKEQSHGIGQKIAGKTTPYTLQEVLDKQKEAFESKDMQRFRNLVKLEYEMNGKPLKIVEDPDCVACE